MKTETFAIRKLTTGFTSGFIISGDGTIIDYSSIGRGPGIVMLHGSMESGHSHRQLAESLADSFTVYLPERRGHRAGGSKDYSMQKEVEDLDALLTQKNAGYVFGVSSGALICLQAALCLPGIEKVALYEPALIINGSVSTRFLSRYENEIAKGETAAALVTAMKGAKLGPPAFNIIPRFLIESLTKMSMKSEEKNAKDGDVTMRMLAPTLHYDFQLITEMAETLNTFKAVKSEVLLLSGSKSPLWLRMAIDPLKKVLPDVKHIEFAGLNHGGSSDESMTNRGSKPELVGKALRKFFSE